MPPAWVVVVAPTTALAVTADAEAGTEAVVATEPALVAVAAVSTAGGGAGSRAGATDGGGGCCVPLDDNGGGRASCVAGVVTAAEVVASTREDRMRSRLVVGSDGALREEAIGCERSEADLP